MASTLREVLTPIIEYILFFASTPEEQQRPFGEVRAAVEKLLERQRDEVRRNEIDPQIYEDGSFAVIAWTDEMILHHSVESNRALHDQWRRSVLQVALFNTHNAGEEFFERLARLTPAQKEVYEVYYLALCLGFRGRHYDEAHEPQLVELRRQCAAHLPVPAIDLFDFERRQEHLTPQPYEVKTPVTKAPSKRVSLYWLFLPLALAALLLLYWLWPSGPNPQDIEDVVHSFECAQIVIASIDRGVVKLNGHVESDEQPGLLKQKVGTVRGVKDVNVDGVNIIPRPFCEVMETLGPLRSSNKNDGFQLELRTSKGCETEARLPVVYHNQEDLVVDVTARKPLNYVYVDYYFADQDRVAHMFPKPHGPESVVNAQALTIPDATDKSTWVIQKPFGLEMVTVLSSPKPLFTPTRNVPCPSDNPKCLDEPAEGYLSSLRPVLRPDAPDAGVSAAYCFIRTDLSTDQ